jgi:hypothetical protein
MMTKTTIAVSLALGMAAVVPSAKERTMRKHFLDFSMALVAMVSSALIGGPARADILVAGRASHSIEWFNNSGVWIDTFASTGERWPSGIAADPLNGDIVAGTLTNTILRFTNKGTPVAGCTLPTSEAGNAVESVLFDGSGDLYVATHYGFPAVNSRPADFVKIYKYKRPIAFPNCVPSKTYTTTLVRGDQMAFDAHGDICIASFPDEDVQCFNQAGTKVFGYKNEILNNGIVPPFGALEPDGVAFDASNRLYLGSAFTGDVIAETTAHSAPFRHLSGSLTFTLGQLTLSGTTLYVPSFFNANNRINSCILGAVNAIYTCQDFRFVIYRLDTSTTPAKVTPFITDHIYGPVQLIFANVTKHLP